MVNGDLKSGFNLNTLFLLIAIIAFIFTAGINYGGVAGYQKELDDFKTEYARKDVLDVRLMNIERALNEIKLSLKNLKTTDRIQ